MTIRTLGDYMKTAGLKFDNEPAPAKVAPAKVAAAPAPKVATETGKQPTTEPAGGHKPRAQRSDAEAEDTGKTAGVAATKIASGSIQFDPAIIKTAAQHWCLEQGALIANPDIAQGLYDQACKQAEAAAAQEAAEKKAALQQQGAIVYHGMLKESAAYQLANNEIDLAGAAKTAAVIGCQLSEIVAHANQIKRAMTDVEIAATPNDVFFAGQKGMAARSSSSETLGGAAQNGNTTEFTPEATAGTRQPAHGPDDNTRGMVDTVTLPGNPGLNHAQKVDQGKGSGE